MNKTKEILSLILAHLRQDSRMPILEIARKIGIPKSTVYDHYRKLRERGGGLLWLSEQRTP